ncbi:class I SAM-dependent methyltransferase [Limnospira fusiformis]|uniref:class I SAM-dependent methyltransferase n=1 Tax=Limnospira fusiformis TaxID=54297 RepID=UPI001448F4CB|nr:class I SAM-dependent methyltransferase [Limnospira fusiformis SAG 85.79]
MSNNQQNINYQDAPALSGGCYSEKKLLKLGLPNLTGKNFLDLGCNMGFYCKYAQTQGASRVVGVDIDKQVINSARQSNDGIEFYDSGWDNFPSGEFDVIICLSAIHYAKDHIELIENIRNHLSPGGLFILEGGVVDIGKNLQSDLLIPSWRQVGDRCRHLSEGFVKNHLLAGFNWRLNGESELRGGDNIPRYVIHAIPKPDAVARSATIWHLDIQEYAACLALSASTIVKNMPSFNYVQQLGSISPEFTSDNLIPILSAPDNFEPFVDDLVFALMPIKAFTRLHLAQNLPSQLFLKLVTRLSNAGLIVIDS